MYQISLHVGASELCKEQSEVLQQDFIDIFSCLAKLEEKTSQPQYPAAHFSPH